MRCSRLAPKLASALRLAPHQARWESHAPPASGDRSQDSYFDGSSGIGGSPKAMKVARRQRQSVGQQPRVDYLALMEEAYGAKESWHQADEPFMRRMIPVLCRKVDDMRERIADLHRYQQLYRTAVQSELKKIPLYKREAWMSPDLTRSLLVDDLQAQGYLDSEGKLKPLEALLQEHARSPRNIQGRAAEGAALLSPGQPVQPNASEAEANAPIVRSEPSAPHPNPPAVTSTPAGSAAVPTKRAPPIVIDPLEQDLHAPMFVEPAPSAPVAPPPSFSQVPSKSSVVGLALNTGGIPRNVDKLWIEFEHGTVQADLNKTGRVTAVKPVSGSTSQYKDPTPRRYDADGRERRDEPQQATTCGSFTHPSGGAPPSEDPATEAAHEEMPLYDDDDNEETGDPVRRKLAAQKKRRRAHRSKIWQHLEDPEVKPGNALHNLAVQKSSELVDVPLATKMAAVEDALTQSDNTKIILSEYPTEPERGPDAMDKQNTAAASMSRETALKLHAERASLKRSMKVPEITGAAFVSTLPKHPDAMPYQHRSADADGVWYRVSKKPGVPGRPVQPGNTWPAMAVHVPWDVHEAAQGEGYEAIRAREQIVRLTEGDPSDEPEQAE
ncbi:hypothetical protein DIPPA_21340 [Diplonema papillatum]|nr:hypothetical protein DIPPA_21340 [Diplonema papillatum]